jgi:peptidoglycan hydrolase CwlO-like protein
MEEKTINYSRTNLIIGIILAVAVIGIIVLSILTFVKTVSDENNINALQDQMVTLLRQLSETRTELNTLSGEISVAYEKIATLTSKENADIAALQDDLSSAADDITSLTNQLSSTAAQVASLQAEVSSDSGTVASLQTQLNSVNSQLSGLATTTTTLQNTLTSLNSTVNSLLLQVKALTSAASNPIALFTSKPISQSAGTQTLLHTFTPSYNGYIYVSGTSNTTTGYIRVTNNTLSTYSDYVFGTGTTITSGVTGGQTYSISFGNTEASGTITANLSGVYYPTAPPGTTPTTLFTSNHITQAAGALTLIYTFTPSQSGYIYITGTSTATTGYIRITNNNTSAYGDYPFGTGGTITASVTAGYSYSIRFGNSEASGTISATLNGTYYH